ncbi:VanZ family protein [Carnobacterium gallinarum]|uniref:VanZ family protein n=1 Tax=Carnobacterium gallinarum TaxID=2749 RepID=UPI0005501E54|nr:VanZ family protein [Carnobacterium gallinarum]
MFFLQNLYNYTDSVFGDTINHFPLIRLIFYSLDRTLQYFIIWLVIRGIYLGYQKVVKKSPSNNGKSFSIARELLVHFFVFYLILLFQLTVFRGESSIMNVHIELRPLSEVNWEPFTETLKLTQGTSKFDFYYNLYGNIFWFIPMGFCIAYLSEKHHPFIKTVVIGMFASLLIESLQFLFQTGVADIDDVIFNTLGGVVGFLCYEIYFLIKQKRHKRKT